MFAYRLARDMQSDWQSPPQGHTLLAQVCALGVDVAPRPRGAQPRRVLEMPG